MIQLSRIDTLNIGLTCGLVYSGHTLAATFTFIVLLVADVTVNYISEVKNNLPLDGADSDCRNK